MNRFVAYASILLLAHIPAGPLRPTRAQPPAFGDGQTTLPANEVTNFKGSLKGMVQNVVVVIKDDGTEAMVAPPDNLMSFQFVAKATPAFLQRGMFVRFTGNFGPGGVPLAPIDKVTLFQPVDLRSVQGRSKQLFTPGVYSEAKDGNRKQPMVGKLSVVGRLIGLAPNGVLAVQAGNVPVQVPVNESTELEVRFNNLALAQEGDSVTVAGFYQPPNENQIKAERITITTERVYGEYVPPTEPRKSRRKRGADTEPDAEPDGANRNSDAPVDDADAGGIQAAGKQAENDNDQAQKTDL